MISLIPKKKEENLLLTKVLEVNEFLNRVKVRGIKDEIIWASYEPTVFGNIEEDDIVAIGFTNDDYGNAFVVQMTADNLPRTSEIYEV